MLLPHHTPSFQGFPVSLLQWDPEQLRHPTGIHSVAGKSLKFLFLLQCLMSGDQPGSKLLLEGFTKTHSALLGSYLNVGRGGICHCEAGDVFHMLEQLKKDFVFKLGMCGSWKKPRALDKFEGMRLEITK